MILVALTIFSRRIHFVLTSGSGTAISWADQTLIPKKRSWAHQPAVQNSLGFFFQHLLTQEHDKLTSLSTFKLERGFLLKCSSSRMQVPGVSPNWWENQWHYHYSAPEPASILLPFQLHMEGEQLAAYTRLQTGCPSDSVEEFILHS